MLGRIAAPRQAWGVTFCELLVGLWREKCRGRHSADGGGILLTSGAVRVRGAPRSPAGAHPRAVAKPREPRPRARPQPQGGYDKVWLFFFSVLFGFLCWSGRRGDRGIHRAQARSVFGDNALASRHSRQPYVHLNHVRRTSLRSAELLHRGGQRGGGALLTSGGAAARELPRPPRRGRGRGQFVNVWCHEPKGVCYKAAFCSSCDHLTDEDVGNEAARSTTVQDAQHDRAGQSVAVFLGSSGR